jgi:Zn-dependent protease with chaperone function
VAIVLIIGGFCLLVLPAVTRRPGRRLNPAEWARLCAALLVGGAAAFELALVLMALPVVARAGGYPELAHVCERMLGFMAPASTPVGWAALVAAVIVPVLALRSLRRAWRTQRRFRIEPELGEHQPYGPHEVVVLPTEELIALSVSGPPGQIVVSQGLVDTLSPAELTAVVRHEAAHLHHRHDRFLLLAIAVETALRPVPLVRRSVVAFRAALERWADEDAAGEHEDGRSTVRSALVGVALAALSPAVAAFSGADDVVERLDALQVPTPRPSALRRVAMYAPVVVVSVIVLVALGAWIGHAHAMLTMGDPCPT